MLIFFLIYELSTTKPLLYITDAGIIEQKQVSENYIMIKKHSLIKIENLRCEYRESSLATEN